MTTCPIMNLRKVSVLEKMKIENALFCIISISLPSAIWADRVAFSNFLHFAKNKTRWIFCIFFSKIVHEMGLFEKIKKNSNFWCCLGILDIYGRALLRPCYTRRFFLQLVSQFCCAVARHVTRNTPPGFCSCNR